MLETKSNNVDEYIPNSKQTHEYLDQLDDVLNCECRRRRIFGEGALHHAMKIKNDPPVHSIPHRDWHSMCSNKRSLKGVHQLVFYGMDRLELMR